MNKYLLNAERLEKISKDMKVPDITQKYTPTDWAKENNITDEALEILMSTASKVGEAGLLLMTLSIEGALVAMYMSGWASGWEIRNALEKMEWHDA